MVIDKRFQVFVSSTFTDLIEERRQVTEQLLRLRCIPSGMELFTASGRPPWNVIEAALETTDYMVLILAGRYGSISSKDDRSYTEREYDHAIELGIPVLAFLHAKPNRLPAEDYDNGALGEKRDAFWKKVSDSERHTVQYWRDAQDLVQEVGTAISEAIRTEPRPGWVRGGPHVAFQQHAALKAEADPAPQDRQQAAKVSQRLLELEAARHSLMDVAGLVLIAEPLEASTDVAAELLDEVSLRRLVIGGALTEDVDRAVEPWAHRLGHRDLLAVSVRCAHPDAFALCSRAPTPNSRRPSGDRSPEHDFCQVGVTDDGGVRVYTEPIGYRSGLTGGPHPGLELEVPVVVTRRFVGLVAALASSTGYRGDWVLGMRTVNAGNLPAIEGDRPTTDRLAGECVQSRVVSLNDLKRTPGAITGALLQRLLRQFPSAPGYTAAFADRGPLHRLDDWPRSADGGHRTTHSLLTAQQQAVAELVAEGLTNAEIAARLQLSRPTVKGHITVALRRLGLEDRTQLAVHMHRPSNESGSSAS